MLHSTRIASGKEDCNLMEQCIRLMELRQRLWNLQSFARSSFEQGSSLISNCEELWIYADEIGGWSSTATYARVDTVSSDDNAIAFGDGETRCSKVRSDQVQNGPSCGAKPATGPCGFTPLEQERPSAFDLPLW